MDSQCMMNNCRAMCPDTEPFCAKHRGEPHGRTDWFAGDVDCDGNELITVRKGEWNTICEQREKFMWQVRDTCTRAENADARITALQAEVARLIEANGILEDALQEAGDDYPGSNTQKWCSSRVKAARQALKGSTDAE